MIRLALRVARRDAEVALAELLALTPAGVEEVDVSEHVVEYAVYGAPGELPSLPALRAVAGEALIEVRTSEIADDWAERWKRFHVPVTIGGPDARRLHVRAPWCAPAEAGVEDIVIDPGQAFGTGAHATTRLCLELLLEQASGNPADGRGSFCDLGCGSGVLAITAARLGWGPVVGVDHERESVVATRDNARANGVSVAAERRDIMRDPLPGAETVAANLLRPLLLGLADRLSQRVRVLIAGGLLVEEADEVAAALSDATGLRESARRMRGEWAALLLTAR